MRRGPVWTSGMAFLTAVLTACAPFGQGPVEPAPRGGLQLSYEDVLAPEVFSRESAAVADAPGGTPGFWAEAPGLPRPERARIENLATDAAIEVALFAGRGGPGGSIRLSGAAAEAIGLGDGRGRVRVTALRREPRIAAP